MAEKTKKNAGKASASRSGPTPAAKKTTAKKTAAKKTAARKSSAEKSSAKKGAATSAPADSLVVLAGEDPWTDAELADQREVLEAESRRLRAEIFDSEAEIADLVRDGSDTAGDDQADTGSKTFEREHEMYLTNSHREILSQTDRALSRIENGTYGVCESCGNPIGKARLQAFPRATLCMSCKQREERR